MTKIIHTEKAPAAIGPYVQAVDLGNLVLTSGQIPVNPANGEVPKDIVACLLYTSTSPRDRSVSRMPSSA